MTRARDIADQQDNLGGAVAPFVAGKNKIINGDFGIWQRGTSFTAQGYAADRFFPLATISTFTLSQQTFSPGAAPVSGYEGTFFARNVVTSGNVSNSRYVFQTILEDVRTFAGQTVTLSFWAKADAAKNVSLEFIQNFSAATGGSTNVSSPVGKQAITTSWARYSFTTTLPSIAGKTITLNNSLNVLLWLDAGSDNNTRASSLGNQSGTFDFWGLQLEAGNVPTSFTTASGSIGGELALCQRYYWRNTNTLDYTPYAMGVAFSTTQVNWLLSYPVPMRTTPSSVDYSNVGVLFPGGGVAPITALFIDRNNPFVATIYNTGATGLTQYRPYYLSGAPSTTSYIGFSAEL